MSFTGFWSLITFEMEPGHPYVGLSLSETGSLIAWNEFFGIVYLFCGEYFLHLSVN